MPVVRFALPEEITSQPPRPEAARHHLPEWFARLDPAISGEAATTERERGNVWPVQTAKGCAPLVDAFTAGYMFRLPQAVRATVVGESVEFVWRSATGDIRKDAEQGHGLSDHPAWQTQGSELGRVYKWHQPWGVDVPTAYSMLYTHPLNRPDLPFQTFSGIVDGGYTSMVSFPFVWLAGDGDYTLDAGTPIAQMIPFFLEEWEAEYEEQPLAEVRRAAASASVRLDGYRTLYRRKKTWRD